jgi:hypothetical protein
MDHCMTNCKSRRADDAQWKTVRVNIGAGLVAGAVVLVGYHFSLSRLELVAVFTLLGFGLPMLFGVSGF